MIQRKKIGAEKWILFAFMLLPTLAISLNLDNDFWFLFNHGEYIIQNGFPITEPFTIHEGLNFTIQQWLFDVIVYYLYTTVGKIGVLFLVFAVAFTTLFLIYQLCMLLTERKFYLSVLITTLSYLVLCVWFFVSRPQIITYMILLAELLCLERYAKQGTWKELWPLPLLSLLQINVHSSMWWLLFAFLTPYLLETVQVKKFAINPAPLPRLPLYIISGVMLCMGFINPYGYKAILYIIGSFGDDTINSSIQEMAAPDVKTLNGAIFFALLLLVVVCYVLNRKGTTRLRYVLLSLGTTLLALMSIKSIPYFLLGTVIPLSFFLRNIADRLYFDNGQSKRLIKVTAMFLVLICVASVYVIVKDYDSEKDYPETKAAIEYLSKHEPAHEISLYTSFYDGGYAEHCGLRTYIDARAEVFLETINGKSDIFPEYMLLQRGSLHYKEFLNKYHFTHILVTESDALEIYLSEDETYDVYYEDENCKIYIPLIS